MEDLNKITSTRVGDNIHFFVNGAEDKGTVVKMDSKYVTVVKDDGNFQDIHINDTFFIKDIRSLEMPTKPVVAIAVTASHVLHRKVDKSGILFASWIINSLRRVPLPSSFILPIIKISFILLILIHHLSLST